MLKLFFLLLCLSTTLTGNDLLGKSPREERNKVPKITVESNVTVKSRQTEVIDGENNCLVADNAHYIEVVLRIHKPGRIVKTMTMILDV